MGFKMTYMELSKFEFNKAMQKIQNSPVAPIIAYKINKLVSSLKKAREQIADEYKNEIIEKYAKRDDNGKYNENDFTPKEELVADFQQAQDEFGKRLIFIDRHPLNIADIRDIKMSSAEMAALGSAFDDSDLESNEGKEMLRSLT